MNTSNTSKIYTKVEMWQPTDSYASKMSIDDFCNFTERIHSEWKIDLIPHYVINVKGIAS